MNWGCPCARTQHLVDGAGSAARENLARQRASLTACPPASKMAFPMRFKTLYEARWIFAVLALLALASVWLFPWLLLLVLLLTLYVFWFFRDPDRTSPTDPDAVLAAADGRVADIMELE